LPRLDSAGVGPRGEAFAFSRDGRKLTPAKSLPMKDAGPETFATPWP
jgi:hypothetical protein